MCLVGSIVAILGVADVRQGGVALWWRRGGLAWRRSRACGRVRSSVCCPLPIGNHALASSKLPLSLVKVYAIEIRKTGFFVKGGYAAGQPLYRTNVRRAAGVDAGWASGP